MIPIRDDVPERGLPLAVVSLILANALAFLHEVSLSVGEGGGAEGVTDLINRWGLIPREFLRGAIEPSATEQVVWLTPVTAMFLHGGLLHLAGNMLYLWVFGKHIEDLLGHGRFLVLYLVCGLAAAAVQVASDPASYAATVGASGAISGVLGAYAVSYPTGGLRLLWPPVRVPAIGFLALWIAIQIIAGVGAQGAEQEPIAWWAHVGGFGAGVALGRSMWVRRPTRSRLRI